MTKDHIEEAFSTERALKLALEALEGIHPGNMTPMAEEYWNKAITVIKQALSDATHLAAPVHDSTCREMLRAQGKAYPRTCKKCGKGPCIALANAALDRMAENAREVGLDYEPVQEPVAWARYPRYTGKIQKADIVFTKPEGKDWLELYTTQPNVATPLAAQRQSARSAWVGLTDEERRACTQSPFTAENYRAIEAKLKAKNSL